MEGDSFTGIAFVSQSRVIDSKPAAIPTEMAPVWIDEPMSVIDWRDEAH